MRGAVLPKIYKVTSFPIFFSSTSDRGIPGHKMVSGVGRPGVKFAQVKDGSFAWR
jgi:hypothetical protein